MTQPSPPPSKLFIRSEVLSVIEFLTIMDAPSRQDRQKQLRRLSNIQDRKTVLEILMKELQRTGAQRTLQAVSELLMELGDIESLQEPLWAAIRSTETRDEVKDAANLILRSLGDETDPDLYLDYLEDPQGLINRETERMLEVAARNPEALIDFIDFIFSLPIEEQVNLLNSLQSDYPPEYLLNIYIPTLLAEPPVEIQHLLFKNIGQTRSKRAALFLYDMQLHYQQTPEQHGDFSDAEELLKTIRRSINELRLAGLYREELMEEYREALKQPHFLVEQSLPYRCFITLPDGIGNQGVILSRRQENGDITMMSVAINDLHGIIDCFGFYQLTEVDFNKISEKFHEEASKIEADWDYCQQKLTQGEALNWKYHNRIPYEYSCWKVMLDPKEPEPINPLTACKDWANMKWVEETANLYQHPDFKTWFLEEGDHPVVTEVLQDVVAYTRQSAEQGRGKDEFLKGLDVLGEALIRGLFTTEWRNILIHRLADAAYLLHCQDAKTFSTLAATETVKLQACSTTDDTDPALAGGFIRQFGRRCIEEQLLRMKHESDDLPEGAYALMQHVLATWDIA